MVRVKQKTPREKKVTWLDEIQAEARRPRKSYTPTPTPTTDAEIMKYIHRKAADQRKNRKLEWWEQLASPTKKQWAYANAYHKAEEYTRQRGALAQKKKQRRRATRHPPMRKKKTPAKKQKNLLSPVGTGAGLSQHCPASVFSSQTVDLPFVGGTCPTQQTESGPVAIKGPPPSPDGHPPPQHHERETAHHVDQRPHQRVSQQHQQQLQGAFARTHDVGRGSMACFVVVLVRA